MGKDTTKRLKGSIRVDEQQIQSHVETVVRSSVEETLNAILEGRLGLGLRQRDVAVRFGVDVSTVTNWELGRTAPAIGLLRGILAFLGYDPFSAADAWLAGSRCIGSPWAGPRSSSPASLESTRGRWVGGNGANGCRAADSRNASSGCGYPEAGVSAQRIDESEPVVTFGPLAAVFE